MQDNSTQSAGPPRHDGYRLQIAPCREHIVAIAGGVTVASSSRVLVMRETRYPPVYYFPRQDVAMHLLARTANRTHCPFKGDATYWSIRIQDQTRENAAWSYQEPYDEAAAIQDHVAFYWDEIDQWSADGAPMPKPEHTGQTVSNPLIGWLIGKAWRPQSIPDVLGALALELRSNGFPLWRARLLIQTLNPMLFAHGYTWQQDTAGIAEFQATHAGREQPQYQDSPFATIINGEGGIRRRLQGPGARLDYPVLRELAAEGATDYVAVPMRFSDGQINILVLVSDAPEGFTTDQLGHLYEILANLSRLLEAHAQRTSSMSLLQTYLGRNAGTMVMDGLVKRGDAQELRAVIWYTDLRDSTLLAEILSKSDYLAALNDYFDCVAGAVVDSGGDVLKFIGDAVLAIFPIETPMASGPSAQDRALRAVNDAHERISVVNAERTAAGKPVLRFGTGLHCDTLTFGNIGTPGRLDFTVIGTGVNKAARIASLCKELHAGVLISGALAANTSDPMRSLGLHELRGFSKPEELFTLA